MLNICATLFTTPCDMAKLDETSMIPQSTNEQLISSMSTKTQAGRLQNIQLQKQNVTNITTNITIITTRVTTESAHKIERAYWSYTKQKKTVLQIGGKTRMNWLTTWAFLLRQKITSSNKNEFEKESQRKAWSDHLN